MGAKNCQAVMVTARTCNIGNLQSAISFSSVKTSLDKALASLYGCAEVASRARGWEYVRRTEERRRSGSNTKWSAAEEQGDTEQEPTIRRQSTNDAAVLWLAKHATIRRRCGEAGGRGDTHENG